MISREPSVDRPSTARTSISNPRVSCSRIEGITSCRTAASSRIGMITDTNGALDPFGEIALIASASVPRLDGTPASAP
jgi:hypothetical protein